MAFKNIKKKQGADHNYFNSFSVTWSQFGAPDGYDLIDGYGPDVLITFANYGLMLTNESTGQIVEYSFNGRTVHGVLDGTTGSTTRSVTFINRQVSLIWFRLKSGGGPANITVTAW